MTTTIDELGERARVLAEHRTRLAEMVQKLKAGIDALTNDALPELRKAIDGATAAWESLRELIEAHPEHFIKPRTMTLSGIKVGFEKGKGGLEIADPEKTVKLIRKHLPDQCDLLIATKETPAKDALALLPADQLKKLGVNVKGSDDQVVIRPADGEVDKLVKAFVKATTEVEP